MTTAFLHIEIFAFCNFALFPDIEGRNRTVVAHYTSPDFAASAVLILNSDAILFDHIYLLLLTVPAALRTEVNVNERRIKTYAAVTFFIRNDF